MSTHSKFYHMNMKKRFLYINVLLIILVSIFHLSPAQGQSEPVKIFIMVTPPYTSKISDYISQPNKIMASLVNTSESTKTVYVLGTFSDGGSFSIFTDPTFKMSPPLVLKPGIPFMLNSDNISQMFDANHIVYQGTTKNELLYGIGLPEGEYTVCLRVYDYETNEPLSPEDPQGCSNIFTVSNVESPMILQPVCGDLLVAATPQIINFLWTRPSGSPPDVTYVLQLFEVLPGTRNVNDAVSSGTLPLFMETTVRVNSFLLGPTGPSMVTGQTYAFLITAIDPTNRVNFRNHGMSEVCSFTWGTIMGDKDVDNDNNMINIRLVHPSSIDNSTSQSAKDYRWDLDDYDPNDTTSIPIVQYEWDFDRNDAPNDSADFRDKNGSYTLTVVQLEENQDPKVAIVYNKPFLKKSGLRENFFMQSEDTSHLINSRNYAWQIVAYSDDGKIIGKSNIDVIEAFTIQQELCYCGVWQENNVTYAGNTQYFGCPHQISINTNTTFSFTFNYFCVPNSSPCGPATYEWNVTDQNGNLYNGLIGNTNSPSVPILNPGVYLLQIFSYCGGLKCDSCEVTIVYESSQEKCVCVKTNPIKMVLAGNSIALNTQHTTTVGTNLSIDPTSVVCSPVNDPNCAGEYKIELEMDNSGTTNTLVFGSLPISIPYLHTFTAPGVYHFIITRRCGITICDMTYVDIVVSTSNCSCTVTPKKGKIKVWTSSTEYSWLPCAGTYKSLNSKSIKSVSLHGYKCSPQDPVLCSLSCSWEIRHGNTLIQQGTGSQITYPLGINTPTEYWIIFQPKCTGQLCPPCKLRIIQKRNREREDTSTQ